MIKKLELINFKSHIQTEINFKNLTVLCGKNGVGKSSVLQSLLLLRETYIENKNFTILDLNGKSVKLGNANDVLNYNDDYLSIKLETESFMSKFTYSAKKESISYINLNKEASLFVELVNNSESLFNTNFQYISAFREGPKNQYFKNDKVIEINKQLSVNEGKAEYFVHFLDYYQKKEVINLILNKKAPFNELMHQVIAWENDICDTIVEVQDLGNLGYALKYSFETESRLFTPKFDAMNVGFGLSYVLPILVAILSSEKGALLFIENPEAHLHPNAIAKLTELICLASQAGIQIVLETHSDHIINGVLVNCKKHELDSNRGVDKQNVSIYQFNRDEENHSTIATEIKVEKNGNVRYVPDGFFDQFTIDRKFIMGI